MYVWDHEHGLITRPFSEFDYAYKHDPAGEWETIFGDRVSKVRRFAKGQPGLFESDLARETRVLTDLYLDDDTVAPGHRLMIFDIEVSSEGGFATVEKADKSITAIGLYLATEDKYYVLLLDPENRLGAQMIERENATIVSCASEIELLSLFLSVYAEYQPTVLSGWNCNGYDIPMLYHRLQNVLGKDEANRLSPIGLVRYSKMREQYQFAGVSVLDYMEMYQKFTYTRKPNYRLDSIGRAEVNMGKVQYDGTLDNFFATDLAKFIEYNLDDVKIVVALDAKLKLIDLVMAISHTGHTPYEDYRYPSKYIEGTIVTYLHRQKRVVPDKSAAGRDQFAAQIANSKRDKFKGAYVKEPIPGLYEWVYNIDVTSLYPSLIRTMNISPETKLGKIRNWEQINLMSKMRSE